MRKPDRQMEAADPRRRAVVAGAGVVGASALLAGCGWDTANLKDRYVADGQTAAPAAPDPTGAAQGGGNQAANQGGSTGSNGSTGGGASALGSTSDIPVGSGKIFSADKVVVVQPTAGDFKAFDTTCSHAGCAVTKISGDTITCPCHGAKFSVTDGSVTGGPAPTGLQPVDITVDGDNIQLA